ncbi:MAG: hypothetical protein J4215_02645 [Candidatus Diapherotrites archaeon]|uniref:Uncharacterized protein n=1 Tax=Candidatus Iainarchaeum sp. TaxID=3101447 RepID=A0A8T4L7G0_9ARCH|nr:hypothetical protein [Candidatus Diapherotrites archaeon]
MNLLIAVVLMLLGATYSEFWIVIGIAAIMVLTERNLSTFVMMTLAIVLIYGFKGVLSDYIPHILLGMIILALVFNKPAQQPQGMDMGGLEGLYGPPPMG